MNRCFNHAIKLTSDTYILLIYLQVVIPSHKSSLFHSLSFWLTPYDYDFQNENKHFQNRSNLSRFTNLYLNSEIPTEIKLTDSPNSSDDVVDKPPKVIKINADVHHQPPAADDEGFKEIVQKKKPKSKKNLKNTSSYVIGVGPSEQLNTLKVAPKKAFLYVSRLAPGTTINTLNITPLSR